jgi:hypothetical protein
MLPTFPMCSTRVFPIAPPFNPICFAQNPPLFNYIGGPKGEALHLSIESSILGGGKVGLLSQIGIPTIFFARFDWGL